jgi:hypothetical protein
MKALAKINYGRSVGDTLGEPATAFGFLPQRLGISFTRSRDLYSTFSVLLASMWFSLKEAT